MLFSGNKGEWSEIYVFLKLLSEQKLYAADSELNKIEDIFYPIIKILRDNNIEYVCNSEIKVIDGSNHQLLMEIPVKEFADKSITLLEKIKNNSNSFRVKKIEDFLTKIHCISLKSKSNNKSDIKLIVHDLNTGFKPKLGFSIKSKLGSPSTLLNAGKPTNFIYRVTPNLKQEEMLFINNIKKRKSKIKDRVKYLIENGYKLSFNKIESDIFELNLRMIDSMLPEIISNALVLFYSGKGTKILELTTQLSINNPIKYNNEHSHNFYKYKIKNFLSDVALGMTPATIWEGKYDATGGYIIVKEDGEIICYHIYNRNEFEDYLLKNTKFDSASSSRHQYALLYKENNECFIKLNLQIRFL